MADQEDELAWEDMEGNVVERRVVRLGFVYLLHVLEGDDGPTRMLGRGIFHVNDGKRLGKLRSHLVNGRLLGSVPAPLFPVEIVSHSMLRSCIYSETDRKYISRAFAPEPSPQLEQSTRSPC